MQGPSQLNNNDVEIVRIPACACATLSIEGNGKFQLSTVLAITFAVSRLRRKLKPFPQHGVVNRPISIYAG
jgi:hypothetical protein